MLVRSGTCAGLVVLGIAVVVLLLRVDKRRTWSVAIASGWDGSTVMENNSAHVTIKDCRTREEKVNMRGWAIRIAVQAVLESHSWSNRYVTCS